MDTVYYGGNTSCVEVRTQGQIIILDAGTGIRGLGRALQAEFQGRRIEAALLISHTHWDHIQGFPFFGPAYQAGNEIRIFGYEGARRGLQSALSVQMDSPYFPIALERIPARLAITELKSFQFKIGEVLVEAQFLNHPGVCTGYRIHTPGGDICYLPDVELCPRHLLHSRGWAGVESKWEHEGGLDERLVDFIQNAAVVIMDSQYTAAEYERHAGWGHSCVDDCVEAVARANVRRFFLFHHDPDRTDEQLDAMLDQARRHARKQFAPVVIDAAREGVSVVLEPSPATV
jgi:phosphoribosyl 1,2-cyclic phosphodiesterase